jgi:RNA polymerase sporulation-specific sigma factor
MGNVFEDIQKAQQGDKQTRDHLVEANSGLVWSVVRKFLNRGHESEDLYQVGCMGLLKAIDKFDQSFGVQFSTYAVPVIMGEIKRYIRDDGMIKVSRSLKELAGKASGARELLGKKLGREPNVSEIAAYLSVSTEELAMALDASIAPESLQAVYGEDERELGEKICDDSQSESKLINQIAMKEAISTLPQRERQIIILRYFAQKTQSQIAELLGISQVQVSRIEKKVLLEMRHKMSIS